MSAMGWKRGREGERTDGARALHGVLHAVQGFLDLLG